jgi:hypothetical protein
MATSQESLAFSVPVVGTTIGLAVLLYGEAAHQDVLIPVGGVVVLASVGLLVALVMRLEGGEDH